MNTNDGGPAFPSGHKLREPNRPYTVGDVNDVYGMTLRDWFAGRALASYRGWGYLESSISDAAKDCYAMADAMLKVRDEQKKP